MVNLGAIIDTAGKGISNMVDRAGQKKQLQEQRTGLEDNQNYMNEQYSMMSGDYQTQMDPYINAGQEALGNIQDTDHTIDNYGSFEMAPMEESDAYNWRLSQGTNTLDQGAANDGSLYSGGQQKALLDYGQNLASQEYDNEYNRQFSEFQDDRDYNTELATDNYNRQMDADQYLNDQGYNANMQNADTQLGLNMGQTQGNMNINNQLTGNTMDRTGNKYGFISDQNDIAYKGAKNYLGGMSGQ